MAIVAAGRVVGDGDGLLGEIYISTSWSSLRTVDLVKNSAPLAGDYNKDRVVDAADYIVRRKMYDESGYHLAADGNGDGVVDDNDLAIWQSRYGEVWAAAGSGLASGAGGDAAPEPSTGFPAALVWIGAAVLRRRRKGTEPTER